MKKYILIYFILQAWLANAQNVGFMGRKCILGTELNALEVFYPETNFFVPKRFAVEYVVDRKHSIGTFYRFFNTTIDDGFRKFIPSNNLFGNKKFKMDLHTYGVYIKRFRKKSEAIAPIGYYNAFELFYSRAIIKDNEGIYLSPGDVIFKTSTVGFGWTMGRQGILVNNFLWDVALNISVPISFNGGQLNEMEKEAVYPVNQAISTYTIVNLKFGIGFLAF